MYTHEYDRQEYPPMPVVEVEVTSLDRSDKQVRLTAIVDTGSDVSFIPLKAIRQLQAESIREVTVSGISGIRYTADLYLVKMRIGPYELFGSRVVGDMQNRAILGRNVLNQLIVTLNGLANEVEVSQ